MATKLVAGTPTGDPQTNDQDNQRANRFGAEAEDLIAIIGPKLSEIDIVHNLVSNLFCANGCLVQTPPTLADFALIGQQAFVRDRNNRFA